MLMQRIKPISRILPRETINKHGLKRSLGPWALTAMGIGAIIGTGIFVLTGVGSATRAGPALTISFIIAGIVSGLAALCYAEVSSKVPISGSAYTYAYSTLGEFFAWIVGWALVLEYALGASTVSVGWSGYFTFILHTLFNINIPQAWQHSHWDPTPGIANLPAAAIILLVDRAAGQGYEGIRDRQLRDRRRQGTDRTLLHCDWIRSHRFGELSLASRARSPRPAVTSPSEFPGMLGGAAFMFFAYIGFDAVLTTAEEARNPGRDLPFGIIMSLAICTVLYIVVVAILDGMVPFYKLNVTFPVTFAMNYVGLAWAGVVIAFGAIAGLTTVLLVMMYGQTRIFLCDVARRLDSRSVRSASFQLANTVGIADHFRDIDCGSRAFFPIGVLGSLTNMGTFLAFILVACAVPLLRNRHPEFKGHFTLPFGPYIVPVLAALSALAMMYYLKNGNPVVFGFFPLRGRDS